MKRKYLFLISILTILLGSFGGTTKIYADSPDYTAKDYFTVSELLPLRSELEEFKNTVCGDDIMCKDYFYYDFDESDAPLGALNDLVNVKFAVTDINPSAKTIKFLYFGEELDFFTMEIEHFNIHEIFVFSLDDTMDNPERRGSLYYEYIERIRTEDNPEGINILIFDSEYKNYEGWFPSGEEVSYNVENFDSIPKKVHVVLNTEHGYFIGTIDLSSCMMSAEYLSGEANSCQLVIAKKGDFYEQRYIGYKYTEPEIELEVESEAESEAKPVTELETMPEVMPENSEKLEESLVETKIQETVAENQESVPEKTSMRNIRSQESATQSSEEPEDFANTSRSIAVPKASLKEEATFPWWILMIIVPGVVVLVWWFWPQNTKK